MEQELMEWIVAMQREGFPVSREIVLVKGNEMYHELYGNRRSSEFIGRSWLN